MTFEELWGLKAFTILSAQGPVGDVLTRNANGDPTFQTPSGGGGVFTPVEAGVPNAGMEFNLTGTDNTKGFVNLQSTPGASGKKIFRCSEDTIDLEIFSVNDDGTVRCYSLIVTNGDVNLPQSVFMGSGSAPANIQLTNYGGRMVTGDANYNNFREHSTVHDFSWTNAQIAALSGTADVLKLCTVPAKTRVIGAYIIIDSAATFTDTLTVSLGRTSASYIDYLTASDAKASANTVYGDASGERGTNMTGYDLPSWTSPTDVYLRFDGNATNLSDVADSAGTVIFITQRVK